MGCPPSNSQRGFIWPESEIPFPPSAENPRAVYPPGNKSKRTRWKRNERRRFENCQIIRVIFISMFCFMWLSLGGLMQLSRNDFWVEKEATFGNAENVKTPKIRKLAINPSSVSVFCAIRNYLYQTQAIISKRTPKYQKMLLPETQKTIRN